MNQTKSFKIITKQSDLCFIYIMFKFREIDDKWAKCLTPINKVCLDSALNTLHGSILESLLIYIYMYPLRFSHILNYLKQNGTSVHDPNSGLVSSIPVDDIWIKFSNIESFDEFRSENSARLDEIALSFFSEDKIEKSLAEMHVHIFVCKDEQLINYAPKIMKKTLVISVCRRKNSEFLLLFPGNTESIHPVFMNKNADNLLRILENLVRLCLTPNNIKKLTNEEKILITSQLPKSIKLEKSSEDLLSIDISLTPVPTTQISQFLPQLIQTNNYTELKSQNEINKN